MSITHTTYNGEPYTVVLLPMAGSIPGAIVFDESGYPTILINSNMNNEQQKATMKHELRHWQRGDAYSEESIRRVES